MTGETPTADAAPLPPPPPPPPPAAPAPPRRSGRVLLIAVVVAFVAGIAAVIALLPTYERWRAPETPTTASAPMRTPAAPATASVTAAAPITLEGLAAREAALDAQLRAIEGRMATVDAASRTAAGYATRAEAMMIAFAARRALDRGLQLGYVEGQLRQRFEGDQPAAVATVIAAAKSPVTLEDLREGLDANSGRLVTGTTREGVWRAVRRELANLVVLRRETTPSPRPADRMSRARRMLEAGQVEAALAEVARMPGAIDATAWIDAAKRYIGARRALATLEVTAISGRAAASVPPAPPAPPAGI